MSSNFRARGKRCCDPRKVARASKPRRSILCKGGAAFPHFVTVQALAVAAVGGGFVELLLARDLVERALRLTLAHHDCSGAISSVPCGSGLRGRCSKIAAPPVRADHERPSVGNEAFGVFVLSFAGHRSESGGSGCSLPVMRSTPTPQPPITSIPG